MTETTVQVAPEVQPIPRRKRLSTALRFDWIMVGLFTWLAFGVNLDVWAHNHLSSLDTFFTPWHAVMYSGGLAIACFLLVTLVGNHARGAAWSKALPAGYNLSVVGVALLMLGGVGDLVWHTLFGIENSWEAVFSPSHLLLAFGGSLIVSGPLRAAWNRADKGINSWRVRFPMLISLTYLLAELGLFTWYSHPFSNIFPACYDSTGGCYNTGAYGTIGTTGIILQTAIMMGWMLLLLRRWELPFGSLTLVLGLSYSLMSFTRDKSLTGGPYPWIIIALLGGLMADFLLWWLKPSASQPLRLRVFAFGVPALLYALYFDGIAFITGIGWTTHVWAGTMLIAGVTGWLVSYLVFPPAYPTKK